MAGLSNLQLAWIGVLGPVVCNTHHLGVLMSCSHMTFISSSKQQRQQTLQSHNAYLSSKSGDTKHNVYILFSKAPF